VTVVLTLSSVAVTDPFVDTASCAVALPSSAARSRDCCAPLLFRYARASLRCRDYQPNASHRCIMKNAV
jgi:hypothetical protein